MTQRALNLCIVNICKPKSSRGIIRTCMSCSILYAVVQSWCHSDDHEVIKKNLVVKKVKVFVLEGGIVFTVALFWLCFV